jgi:hypothetical protein
MVRVFCGSTSLTFIRGHLRHLRAGVVLVAALAAL